MPTQTCEDKVNKKYLTKTLKLKQKYINKLYLLLFHIINYKDLYKNGSIGFTYTKIVNVIPSYKQNDNSYFNNYEIQFYTNNNLNKTIYVNTDEVVKKILKNPSEEFNLLYKKYIETKIYNLIQMILY